MPLPMSTTGVEEKKGEIDGFLWCNFISKLPKWIVFELFTKIGKLSFKARSHL